ncbi:hypothetical protein BH09PSE3_BH09PSE3_15220 [soil metagenome]
MPRLRSTPCNGGFIFAENPARAAPEAQIIWHADLDPGALRVTAVRADPCVPDAVDPARLAPWLAVAIDRDGHEHAVLTDGWLHIRLDVAAGSLVEGCPVILHYDLHGVQSARKGLLPLSRLLHLCRHGRFAASLFPADARVPRGLVLLRVHDALVQEASQRDIAVTLFGDAQVDLDWSYRSDALRSRMRRLVADARAMARGGYRALMRDAR